MKIKFEPKSLSWISRDGSNKCEKLSRDDASVHRKPKVRCPDCCLGWIFVHFLFALTVFSTIYSYYKLVRPYYEHLGNSRLGTFQFQDIEKNLYSVDISWSKCGTDKYGVIEALQVSPNPISLHKNVTFSLEANVFSEITSPLKVEVKVKKEFLFSWITIPCIDSFGSCTYSDVCQFSPYIHNATCELPIPRSHLPCNCPIKVDRYYARRSVIHIEDPAKYIPRWLKDGKYWARVEGFNNGTNIGCYDFSFAVTS